MPAHYKTFLIVLLVFLIICLPGNEVCAFGAGNIPNFAHIKGQAFRHGDIEQILRDIFKKHGASVGIMGSIIGKHKFGDMDVKRIYFGNWLRDYSQAIDVATLQKSPFQTLMNIVTSHGYATGEFEVTRERLGVYLPVEHIDNPKGYGNGQDARNIHPDLRPPVNSEELEIDPRTGMKNYIANDSGSWDTSRAHVRRTFEKCIQFGRQYRVENPDRKDKYESFRLLGSALHTLEDFSAHSNFCELCLVSMGYTQVFTHVGDTVRVRAPNGFLVPPLVTGVFGANDFMHSLFSGASDQIVSVTDLNSQVARARSKRGSKKNSFLVDGLKKYIGKISAGTGISQDLDEMGKLADENEESKGGKRPEDMSPHELHSKLWAILSLRDRILQTIERTTERVPGLKPLLDKIDEQISVIVLLALAPLLRPLMYTISTSLHEVSQDVISTEDQFEVFDNPSASDPTHSFLSKDHFDQILNEPAGHIARIIVTHAVTLVVQAWDDPSANVDNIIDEITECLFHPDFYNPKSKIQSQMLAYMHDWVNGLGDRKASFLQRLSKQSVREHQNVRLQGESGTAESLSRPLGLRPISAIRGIVAPLISSNLRGLPNITGLSRGRGRRRARMWEDVDDDDQEEGGLSSYPVYARGSRGPHSAFSREAN